MTHRTAGRDTLPSEDGWDLLRRFLSDRIKAKLAQQVIRTPDMVVSLDDMKGIARDVAVEIVGEFNGQDEFVEQLYELCEAIVLDAIETMKARGMKPVSPAGKPRYRKHVH